jgi:hypothetical protein
MGLFMRGVCLAKKDKKNESRRENGSGTSEIGDQAEGPKKEWLFIFPDF